MGPKSPGRGATNHRARFVALLTAALMAGCGGAGPIASPPSGGTPGGSFPTAVPTTLATSSPAPSAPLGPTPTPTPIVAPTPEPIVAPTVSPSPGSKTYVIVAGDTLRGIADRFGLTLDQLLAANPSITDPDRFSIGDVLNIPTLSLALVIEAAPKGGSFATSNLHVRLGEEPTIRVAGDPRWVEEQVYWQIAESAIEPLRWRPYGDDTLDTSGRATKPAEVQGGPYAWRAYRARLPASAAHPDLVSKPLVIEWGGQGPCPAEAVEYIQRPLVAPGGTTYTLVPGEDSAFNSEWSIVASNPGRVTGTIWRYQLDPCWEPGAGVVGSDATLYVPVVYRAGPWAPDAPQKLVVAGPEGFRAEREFAGSIEQAPNGTVFMIAVEVSEASGHEPAFRSMTMAALGPDGRPTAGWPFTTDDPSSRPVFSADGTVHIAQSTTSGDRVIALGPNGRMKPGWPYAIPGRLEWTICGAGCANVPDAPSIAPDGSLFDNFDSGIYMVNADGRAKRGWPYTQPPGTFIPSACRFDTPGCEGFDPVLTADGRIYVPRHDERYATAHDDMLCLRLDGTLCPGWPVRLPELASDFSVDEHGIVHVNRTVAIRPDGVFIP